MPRARADRTRGDTKLARIRLERELAQQDVANAAGISIATYRRLERGQIANPSLRHLTNLAFVLDVELDDLFEEEWLLWWRPWYGKDPPGEEWFKRLEPR